MVTAHYCTEAASSNNDQWQQVIQNISTLVKPQGMFLLSVSTGLTRLRKYGDQSQAHGSPNLTATFIKQTLEKSGYNLETLTIEYLPAPDGYDRPYQGTWLVSIFKH